MPDPKEERLKPYTQENDNLKPDDPPRPATEPNGSEGSVRNKKTLTDPGSGEPTRSN